MITYFSLMCLSCWFQSICVSSESIKHGLIPQVFFNELLWKPGILVWTIATRQFFVGLTHAYCIRVTIVKYGIILTKGNKNLILYSIILLKGVNCSFMMKIRRDSWILTWLNHKFIALKLVVWNQSLRIDFKHLTLLMLMVLIEARHLVLL